MPDLACLRSLLSQPLGRTSDFDLKHPGLQRPADRPLQAAAVLVAIVPGRGVLLTKRASHLRNHPGQIAFPGGKVDASDLSPEQCALREAREEVGLPPAAAEVLGRLPPHETVTGFVITPVLAYIHQPFSAVLQSGEVEEAFVVPLDHLLDLGRYAVEQRRWQGHARRYFAVPWGPYYIWGATACILHGLACRAAS